MYRVESPGRSSQFRTLLIVAVLFGLTASALPLATGYHATLSISPPAGGAAPIAHSGAVSSASSRAPAHAAVTSSRATVPAAPHPAASVTGSFWTSNSGWFTAPSSAKACTYSSSSFLIYNYSYSYCNDQQFSPSVLNLANGDIAVAYASTTSLSATSCLGPAANTVDRIEFSLSTDNGTSFGPSTDIGNNTCTYLDAAEPSFVVGPGGTIYGVFVEYNQSTSPGQYLTRPGDAIGFTYSTNNGASFSTPVTINAQGNISKPQVAVFGDSVYVLYENISNGTSTYMYGLYGYYSDPAISENLLFSSNGGSSWTGPTTLPGENSSAGNSAFGGWLAINASGMVGVSYFTNQSCIANSPGFFYSCWSSGADLVYTTSTNNGSTWAPLVTIQSAVGETQYYTDGFFLDAWFQVEPQTQLAFSADGQTAYIVYAGTYNKTAINHAVWTVPYYDYNSAGIFFAMGTSAGTGWIVTPVALPMPQSDTNDNWNPSLGISGGTIYVTYTESNTTYCEQYSGQCSPLQGGYSQWVSTSTNGINFTSPSVVSVDQTCQYGECETYWADESFAGYNSAVGFTSSGSPILVYAMPGVDSYVFQEVYNPATGGYNFYYNYTDPTALTVALPFTGSTLWVNFTESGLVNGTQWNIVVNGEVYSTTDSWINVTNVPYGESIAISTGPAIPDGWGTLLEEVASTSGFVTFFANSTDTVSFEKAYLLQINAQPSNGNAFIYTETPTFQYYEQYIECFPVCTTYVFTYFPDPYYLQGTKILLYAEDGISFWSGTGNASYTGPGFEANVTFYSPINETGWIGAWGYYNVSFNALGLPSTSTVHFDFNGISYSGPASGPINVSNVETGAYEVTNVWATSTTVGWEYFGLPSPANPIFVPAESQVGLTFSLVDVAAAAGTVTFQAQGLTLGTVWTFEFNGTTYSSDTPWINVTSHPGTFTVHGFPVVAENDSVGYVPAAGIGPTWTVSPGSTYTVTFVPAYKVTVIVGTGGNVAGGTGSFWVAEGASSEYVASARAGYGFGGWTGTGLGSYTGPSSYANLTVNGPIVQTASFYPLPGSRFNLTFNETGLAAGTWWTVFLGGMGFSSDQALFVVGDLLACGDPGGNYNLTIPYAYSSNDLVRYIPVSHLAPTVCTSGTTVVHEVFSAQYYLTLQSTAGGLAEATIGSNTVVNSLWVAAGVSVDLTAVGQTGYDFLGWNGTGYGNYTGASIVQGIVMSGPITELATFQLHYVPPAATYTLTFKESNSLVPGTVWGVTLGHAGYSTTTATLVVPGLLAASYTLTVPAAFSPDGQTRYQSIGAPTSENVQHNATVTLTFSVSYWVSIEGTPGGTVSPGSGWVTADESILLNATPSAGFVFVGWNGNGNASYTGSNLPQTVPVTSPITEVATFAPVAKIISTTSSSGSLWSQPTTWIGLGLVGLLVGLVVGIIVSRRGGREPPAPAAYGGPTNAPSETTEGGDSSSSPEGAA